MTTMQSAYARLTGSSWDTTVDGSTTPSPSYTTFEREEDVRSFNVIHLSPIPLPPEITSTPLRSSLALERENGGDQTQTRLLRLNYKEESVLTVSPMRYEEVERLIREMFHIQDSPPLPILINADVPRCNNERVRLHPDAWPLIRNEITTIWVTHPGTPSTTTTTPSSSSSTNTSLTTRTLSKSPEPLLLPLPSSTPSPSPPTTYQITTHLWSYNSLSLPKVKHSPTLELSPTCTISTLRARLSALYPQYSITGRFVKVDVMHGRARRGGDGIVLDDEVVEQEHYQVYFRDSTPRSKWFW